MFEISRDVTVSTGRLGVVAYVAGWYAYVGSALKGVSSRLKHHARKERARPHWHIDRLLPHGELRAVVAAETSRKVECLVAEAIGRHCRAVPRFGASDCRCPGHLFFAEDMSFLLHTAQEAFDEAGCRAEVVRGEDLQSFV